MDRKNSTLDDIAAEIGLTAALRLSAWFGDENKCYVPVNVEEGQLLVKLIGMSAARKLTAAFPGDLLAIPRLRQYEDDLRNRQIGQMLTKGFTTNQIAVWFRMSERRAQQICQDLEMAGLIDPIGPGKKRPGKVPQEKPPEKAPAKSRHQEASQENGLQKVKR